MAHLKINSTASPLGPIQNSFPSTKEFHDLDTWRDLTKTYLMGGVSTLIQISTFEFT